MRKLVLWKKHDCVLIGEPAEPTKLALEIDDVIENLSNPISLEDFSKSHGMYVSSIYGGVLWDQYGGRELHSIGSTEK